MSMTKTGIIGLVVLIVILIGGYSIVTQAPNDGSLGQTDMGTTTDEQATSTEMNESSNPDDGGSTETGNETNDTNESSDTADTMENGSQENDTTDTTDTTATNETPLYGIGGSGEVGATTEAMEPKKDVYFNEDWGVAFAYPETWNIDKQANEDEDVETVVVGADFAGGMKAEMTVVMYEDATIRLGEKELVLGKKYEIDLECKDENLDCAGVAFVIPVEGEMTQDGFEGKVVKVSYGVFEMPDYEGPEVGVSVGELYDVADSVFSGAASSLTIQGVSLDGGGFAPTGVST